ncbi:MAG: AAA family ATPase [Stackebrandtia sp.]
MRRMLITGMSATGKSTVISDLAAMGHKAVDTDVDGWCGPADGSVPRGRVRQPDWVWREDRMTQLLSTLDADLLFVSGCVENQAQFYPWFDHVVLLSAPEDLIRRRLATRSTNSYGKHPQELAREMRLRRTVEPLPRAGATAEIDTTVPPDDVTAVILRLAGG